MPLQDSDIFLVTKADGSESRHIRADKLFSGIADDWLVVIQDGTQSKRCLVSELADKASDDRYMLVNSFAPGVTTGDRDHSYKIKSSTVVKKYGKKLTDIITNVGLGAGVDYALFTQCRRMDNGQEYTGPWDSAAVNPTNKNVVYDGNENTNWFPLPQKFQKIDVEFVFKPPLPIRVNGLVEIKGGVQNLGGGKIGTAQLFINGDLIFEKQIWDENPEWASGSYSGDIVEIVFKQKEPAPTTGGKRFSINAFKIDGEYLISNQPVTELTFSSDKGLDRFAYNDVVTQIKQDGTPTIPAATGHVGEIYDAKMSLLKIEPNWQVGNYIELPDR